MALQPAFSDELDIPEMFGKDLVSFFKTLCGENVLLCYMCLVIGRFRHVHSESWEALSWLRLLRN